MQLDAIYILLHLIPFSDSLNEAQEGVNMRKPSDERKVARITVSLKPGEHNALSKLAEARDVSLSWVVRKAVEQYIELNLERDQIQLDLPQSRFGTISQHRE